MGCWARQRLGPRTNTRRELLYSAQLLALPTCLREPHLWTGFSTRVTRSTGLTLMHAKPFSPSLMEFTQLSGSTTGLASKIQPYSASYRGNSSRILSFAPGDQAPETISLRRCSTANSDCRESSDSVGKLYLVVIIDYIPQKHFYRY